MNNNKLTFILLLMLILIVAGCLEEKSYAPSVSPTQTQTFIGKIKPQPIPNCTGGLCKANLSVILVKNLLTDDTCNNTVSHTSLNDSEISDMKYVVSTFVSEVYNSTDGRFILNPVYHEIPEVKVSFCKEFWMAPWDIYPFVKDDITKDTDFIVVYFDLKDDTSGVEKIYDPWGGGTKGPEAGIHGAAYTSIGLRSIPVPIEYIQSTFHEWLHQLSMDMFSNNKVDFEYTKVISGVYTTNYPPCGQATIEAHKWNPSSDEYMVDPDWKNCGIWHNHNATLLLEYNRHILFKHFDTNLSWVFNRCRDGIKNGPETDVDTGGYGNAACPK